MAFVIILDRTASGAWRRIDTLRFREHHVAPRVSFESFISPGNKEIVVRNNEIDYGTGIENIRMTIYSVTNLGTKVIFDQPSQLVRAIAASKGNQQVLTNQSETDIYEFVDAANGTKYIHRAEKIRDGQVEITRSWEYDWHPEYRAMVGFQINAQTPMQDFEMEVCNAIEDKWAWPQNLILAGQLGPAVINFDYIRDSVSNVKVTRSSGSSLTDKSYIEAITKAQMPKTSVTTQSLYLTATLDVDMGEDDMCFRSKIHSRDAASDDTLGLN